MAFWVFSRLNKTQTKTGRTAIFLISVSISVLLTIVLGIVKANAALNPKAYIARVAGAALVVTPITGALEGTFYSHGFNIYWWWFSLANFTIVFVVSLIVVIVVKFFVMLKIN